MSIFLDEKVYEYAAGSLNNIIISDYTGKTINGFLQETLQFSVEAEWDNIFSLNERFSNLKQGLGSINYGIFNAGILTKKYYKGGSYLKINPKIRVTDWNATGDVLKAAKSLIDMCLPVYDKKLEALLQQTVNNLEQKFAEFSKKTKAGKIKSITDGIEATGEFLIDETLNILNPLEDIRMFKKFINNGKEFLSNSPRTIFVQISTYYRNEFVIDSVQVEFSKEMTEAGPLYVDISMALSTPIVTTRGNSGLLTTPRQPRFINVD